MSKKFSMDIWKFLSRHMTFEEKKRLIREKDIQIKGFHGSVKKTESQWQMAISRFETELKSAKVQTALVLYYVEKLEAEKEVLVEKGDEAALEKMEHCFETLHSKSIEEIQADIEQEGNLEEVLIHLIVLGEKEKANALVERLPKENELVETADSSSSETEAAKTLFQKRIHELEQKLAKAEASERRLKKANRALEKKYADFLEKKNGEIRGWEKKLADARGVQEELQQERERTRILAEEKTMLHRTNTELNDQLATVESEKEALAEELQLAADFVNTENEEIGIYKEGVKNVLVFGSVPIMVRKDPDYHIQIFDGDCLTYDFIDDYDAYWYVVDKLSPKMRLELSRNECAAGIKWTKMHYSDAFGRSEAVSV